jgi:hypothetical protein
MKHASLRWSLSVLRSMRKQGRISTRSTACAPDCTARRVAAGATRRQRVSISPRSLHLASRTQRVPARRQSGRARGAVAGSRAGKQPDRESSRHRRSRRNGPPGRLPATSIIEIPYSSKQQSNRSVLGSILGALPQCGHYWLAANGTWRTRRSHSLGPHRSSQALASLTGYRRPAEDGSRPCSLDACCCMFATTSSAAERIGRASLASFR